MSGSPSYAQIDREPSKGFTAPEGSAHRWESPHTRQTDKGGGGRGDHLGASAVDEVGGGGVVVRHGALGWAAAWRWRWRWRRARGVSLLLGLEARDLSLYGALSLSRSRFFRWAGPGSAHIDVRDVLLHVGLLPLSPSIRMGRNSSTTLNAFPVERLV